MLKTLGVHFIRHPCLTRKLRVLPPAAPKIIPRLLSGRKCSGVVELRSLGSARPCADFVHRHRASLHVVLALLVSHPCETLGVHFIRHPCLTRKLRVLPPAAPKIIPRLLSGRKCSGVVELRSLGSARPCADFVRPPSCIHARPASCGFSHPPTHKKCNPTQ